MPVDPRDDFKALGQRMVRARLDLGAQLGRVVTQQEVAEAMGVTSASVSAWEAGLNQPSRDKLARLATVLGVRAGWLAFDDGPMHYGDPEPEDGKNGGHLKRA